MIQCSKEEHSVCMKSYKLQEACIDMVVHVVLNLIDFCIVYFCPSEAKTCCRATSGVVGSIMRLQKHGDESTLVLLCHILW